MNTNIWHPRHKAIVVGLSLDATDQDLLHTAIALARKLESPLELVHATQPIFNYMGAGDVVVNPYYGYDRVINDLEDEDARKGLDTLRQTIPADVKAGVHVLRDYASEALTTIATEVHAGLIICGISKDASANFLGGMSTAFSLASHAEVPVLIVPLGVKLDVATRPRMLVADNLEVEGRRALEVAIQLADELDCAEICHTHVHQLGITEVQHMVDKVREAMTLGRIPHNPEFSSRIYVEQIRGKINDELRYRFHNSQGAYRVKMRYETLVAFGNPVEELHKITLQHSSQLLVFGRHHLFHRRRFAVGKIPYNAMMEQGVATLIVPDLDSVANT